MTFSESTESVKTEDYPRSAFPTTIPKTPSRDLQNRDKWGYLNFP